MTNEALPYGNFSIKISVVENVMTKNEDSKGLDLLSVGVSRRRGSVPTLSDCGLRAISGAPLWPRLCVLFRPWSVVPELSDRH